MPSKLQAGHELIIPLFEVSRIGNLVTIEWTQPSEGGRISRKEDYFALTATNAMNYEMIPFFIAAEYYQPLTSANRNHIENVGEYEEGGYRIKVNDRLQCGQANAAGDYFFLVYHDTNRAPFQHRFVETAFRSVVLDKVNEVAKSFDFPQGFTVRDFTDLFKKFTGSYLRTVETPSHR